MGSGDNDIKMLRSSSVAFSTNMQCQHEVKKVADIVLTKDSLQGVIETVGLARAFKDHLMKFILLQLPTSVSAVALVVGQILFYQTTLFFGLFIFLINLTYYPVSLACMLRES